MIATQGIYSLVLMLSSVNLRLPCHNDGLQIGQGKLYAEIHHIKPLGAPHNGLDVRENVLCVCPNCHVLLDYGAIQLDVSKLRVSPKHRVGKDYIDYHNTKIVGKANEAG